MFLLKMDYNYDKIRNADETGGISDERIRIYGFSFCGKQEFIGNQKSDGCKST